MPQPKTISDYLDILTHELRFDLALAHRVRQEVEDHLWEATTAGPGDASADAQQRAIRNFGDPRDVASQYAALSFFRQTRRTGMIVILAIAGIFVAMKGRIAWAGLMHWSLSAAQQRVGKIDHYAFFVALAVGIAGWAYIGSRRVSATFHAAYRSQMKRCLLLCMAATGTVIASVIMDAILIGLRLFRVEFRATALVPLLSMAAEIAFAYTLVVHLRKTIQRAARAWSLFPN